MRRSSIDYLLAFRGADRSLWFRLTLEINRCFADGGLTVQRVEQLAFGGPLAGDLPVPESAFDALLGGMFRFRDYCIGSRFGLITRADHPLLRMDSQ